MIAGMNFTCEKTEATFYFFIERAIVIRKSFVFRWKINISSDAYLFFFILIL